jgi:deoxyribonuclease (pyrimidine dimer)
MSAQIKTRSRGSVSPTIAKYHVMCVYSIHATKTYSNTGRNTDTKDTEMTRINTGIHPKYLIDQHLIAELHELPRIFTLAKKRMEKDDPDFSDIPEEFTLGTGHVTFFYNKLSYLLDRYIALVIEYTERFDKQWNGAFYKDLKDTADECIEIEVEYKPGAREAEILRGRISTRINEMQRNPRYRGMELTRKEAINIVNKVS